MTDVTLLKIISVILSLAICAVLGYVLFTDKMDDKDDGRWH